MSEEQQAWKRNLTQGQISVVEDIIGQLPTTMGFQDAFIGILNKMAGELPKDKFRFIIAGDGDLLGTNDSDLARKFAADEEYYVADVRAMKWLLESEDADTAIVEKRE
jgi:hypothetical protein